jgi:hypothetical protein
MPRFLVTPPWHATGPKQLRRHTAKAHGRAFAKHSGGSPDGRSNSSANGRRYAREGTSSWAPAGGGVAKTP